MTEPYFDFAALFIGVRLELVETLRTHAYRNGTHIESKSILKVERLNIAIKELTATGII